MKVIAFAIECLITSITYLTGSNLQKYYFYLYVHSKTSLTSL